MRALALRELTDKLLMENFTTSVEIFVQRKLPYTAIPVSHEFHFHWNRSYASHYLGYSPNNNQNCTNHCDVT